MAYFTSITKEGSIIVMQTDEREKPFKFNCAERKLYSFTGRQVSTINPILRQCEKNSNCGVSLLIDALYECVRNHNYSPMSKMEMFIPYLDIIDAYSINEVPDTLPKGYIKWVKENNVNINNTTFNQFLLDKKMEKMPKTIAEVYNIIKEGIDNHFIGSYVLDRFLNLKEEDRKIFCKIFKTSMKTFNWNFAISMENFIYHIASSYNGYGSFPAEWREYVDTNRSFAHNETIIREIKDKIKSEKILSWENKFSAIETLSNDTYTIIVPKTMEEFTDEGKQQNNCIGNYYHDDMARNTQIIYFIRRKSNPNKSYLTNRYAVYSRETVETRKINNTVNMDIASRNLIIEIDKMITDILKTL